MKKILKKTSDLHNVELCSVCFVLEKQKRFSFFKKKETLVTISDHTGILIKKIGHFFKISFSDKKEIEKLLLKNSDDEVVDVKFCEREERPCEIFFPEKNLKSFVTLIKKPKT